MLKDIFLMLMGSLMNKRLNYEPLHYNRQSQQLKRHSQG